MAGEQSLQQAAAAARRLREAERDVSGFAVSALAAATDRPLPSVVTVPVVTTITVPAAPSAAATSPASTAAPAAPQQVDAAAATASASSGSSGASSALPSLPSSAAAPPAPAAAGASAAQAGTVVAVADIPRETYSGELKRLEAAVHELTEANDRIMAQNIALLADLEAAQKAVRELRADKDVLALQLRRVLQQQTAAGAAAAAASAAGGGGGGVGGAQ